MRIASVFKKSSIYLMGDITRRGIGFLMIPFYTHYLTPADYGLLEMIELFIMVTTIAIGVSAVGDAMIRLYHDHPDRQGRHDVVATAITCVTVLSVAILIPVLLLAEPISSLMFTTPKYANLIRAGFGAMCLGNLYELLMIHLQIRQRAVLFVAFSVGQFLAMLSLNIYFIAGRGLGVWGFLLSKLICTSISVLLLLVGVLREIEFRFRPDYAKSIAQFGGPLIFSSTSIFVIHFSDRFFLNHYSTLAEVGIYALAYKIGWLVSVLVGGPFGNAWNTTFYSHVSEHDWKQQFARVASYLIFFATLSGIVFSVFSRPVLTLMTEAAYHTAAVYVPIIAFAYVFRTLGDFFRGLLFINKRVQLFSGISTACALLNIGLNFALIPAHGAYGAAWATLLTWLAYLAGCWVAVHREHRVPFGLRPFAMICLLSLVVLSINGYVPLGWLWQWGSAVLLVIVFSVATWLSGYFPHWERQLIRAQVTARLGEALGRVRSSVSHA